jgi:hypothetical protein
MNAINRNDWGQCPRGEWQRLSAALVLRKWWLFARNAFVAVAAVALLTGGALVAVAKLSRGSQEQHCCPAAPCGSEKTGCPSEPPRPPETKNE